VRRTNSLKKSAPPLCSAPNTSSTGRRKFDCRVRQGQREPIDEIFAQISAIGLVRNGAEARAFGFRGCSHVPNHSTRKQSRSSHSDRNRLHAQEAPPIPTTPVATRNHRVVPEPIAILANFQHGVPCRRGATRKENDKNRETETG